MIQSPEGVTTSLSINLFGNITAISQGGQTEYRSYDQYQRLCKTQRNDVGQTVFGYNSNNQISWQAAGSNGGSAQDCHYTQLNNNQVSFAYDNLGQQRSVSYQDGTASKNYTYNTSGDLTQLSVDGQAGTEVVQDYVYNQLRQLTRETTTIASANQSWSFDYQYNALGHQSSISYPDSWIGTIEYAPNAFGQPTQAVGPYGAVYASNAQYHPNGSLASFNYGNGVVHNTELNARQLPESVHDAFGQTDVMHLSYQYDNNNNITRLSNLVDSSFSLTSLAYDGLDRLTDITGNSGIGNTTIRYDQLGNIQTKYSNGRQLSYIYDSNNRLSNVSDALSNLDYDFAYDSRGQVVDNGRRSFSLSSGVKTEAANQMTGSDGSLYLYDGHNRRLHFD